MAVRSGSSQATLARAQSWVASPRLPSSQPRTGRAAGLLVVQRTYCEKKAQSGPCGPSRRGSAEREGDRVRDPAVGYHSRLNPALNPDPTLGSALTPPPSHTSTTLVQHVSANLPAECTLIVKRWS